MSAAETVRNTAFNAWVDRHSISTAPVGAPKAPSTGTDVKVNETVLEGKCTSFKVQYRANQASPWPALRNAIPGITVKAALRYGTSLWGQAVKLEALHPSGERKDYLLKVTHTYIP